MLSSETVVYLVLFNCFHVLFIMFFIWLLRLFIYFCDPYVFYFRPAVARQQSAPTLVLRCVDVVIFFTIYCIFYNHLIIFIINICFNTMSSVLIVCLLILNDTVTVKSHDPLLKALTFFGGSVIVRPTLANRNL